MQSRCYNPWMPGIRLVKIDQPVDQYTAASDTRALTIAVEEVDRVLSSMMAINKHSGSCTVTQSELWDTLPVFSVIEQEVSWLQLLKDKGAPVVGKDRLRLDPNFCLSQCVDFTTGDITVNWWRC